MIQSNKNNKKSIYSDDFDVGVDRLARVTEGERRFGLLRDLDLKHD